MIDFITTHLFFLIKGALLSISLTLISLFIGIIASFSMSFGLVYGFRWLRYFLRMIIYIIKGTPLLVQIFILYFGFGQAKVFNIPGLEFFKSPFYCAVIALSFNSCCYMSSIISEEIFKIPSGQITSARLLGISSMRINIRIIVPQVLRAIYSALLNESSILLKSTSIASGITLMELMGKGNLIISETYQVGKTLTMIGLLYVISNFIIINFVKLVFGKKIR